jgi:hypothetical protein
MEKGGVYPGKNDDQAGRQSEKGRGLGGVRGAKAATGLKSGQAAEHFVMQ